MKDQKWKKNSKGQVVQATGVARTVGATGKLRNLQRPSWSVADDGRIKKEEGDLKRKDAQ